MFKNLKPGQKLWSLRFGEVEFIEYYNEDKEYPIVCKFLNFYDEDTDSWTEEGFYEEGEKTRDLYFSQPEIIENKPVHISGFINLYTQKYNNKYFLYSGSCYETKKEAELSRLSDTKNQMFIKMITVEINLNMEK